MTAELNIINLYGMNQLLSAYNSAIERLRAAKGKHKAIAEKVGKTPAWISLIASEKIADPGIKAMAMLIDALDELELSGKLEPRADSVGQGADAAQPEVFYGVDKGMSPVYQQVTLDKPRVLGRFVGRDQEKMQVGVAL
ncbi:hypothetical protein [Thiothrix sp.]|uniref:hypothetical protein n=1 Tax=Thiothrix sp. TaxID=1032 RepID=UPI00257E1631|nr:hypothetical protein [Thiothrix sp.]